MDVWQSRVSKLPSNLVFFHQRLSSFNDHLQSNLRPASVAWRLTTKFTGRILAKDELWNHIEYELCQAKMVKSGNILVPKTKIQDFANFQVFPIKEHNGLFPLYGKLLQFGPFPNLRLLFIWLLHTNAIFKQAGIDLGLNQAETVILELAN